jgi:hypothetical protein
VSLPAALQAAAPHDTSDTLLAAELQDPDYCCSKCSSGHLLGSVVTPEGWFGVSKGVRSAMFCRLNKQRKEIITMLQTLTLEGDNGYGSAVDKTDELRRNMQQEASHLTLCRLADMLMTEREVLFLCFDNRFR